MKTKDFCIAAARLIYDMITADGIVSDRELELMTQVFNEKYSLNSLIANNAYKKTFCEALQFLQKWPNNDDIKELYHDLLIIANAEKDYFSKEEIDTEFLTRIEGRSSVNEARLLFATHYALFHNAKVFSLDETSYRFSKDEIVYLENTEMPYFHEELSQNYRELKAYLELYGLRLIYIPKICEYLIMKREQRKLIPIMRIVNPFDNYEDNDAQQIANNISNITTSDFAKELFSFSDKMFVNFVPSFLMKIKTSNVFSSKTEKKKTDFILIPIKTTVRNTLYDSVKTLTSFTHDFSSHSTRRFCYNSFVLHGFDRTFLNFVMNRVLSTEHLTKVIFDFRLTSQKVIFSFGGNRTEIIKFSKPILVYLLIIFFSQFKGIPALKLPSWSITCSRLYEIILNKTTNIRGQELYSNNSIGVTISRLNTELKKHYIPSYYLCKNTNNSISLITFHPELYFLRIEDKQIPLFEYYHQYGKCHKSESVEKSILGFFCSIFMS